MYENEARNFTDEEDWIVVENTHEAIVDKELFDRVRAVMEQKVEDSAFSSERGKKLPIKDDIFAGILFCGNCKRRLPQLSRILEKDGGWSDSVFIPVDTIMTSAGISAAVPFSKRNWLRRCIRFLK